MSTPTPSLLAELPALLRGELEFLQAWVTRKSWSRVAVSVTVIVIGTGLFGAALGSWRAPMQALYAGLKLPLVLLLTALLNGLINALLAPLLGLNLSLRASLSAVLASFAICAAILGSLSPILAFLIWNSPALGSGNSGGAHSMILITNVGSLALSGAAGNLRLYQTLAALGNAAVARRVLVAWLGMNLFLGSQLSWVLRPFVGSPGLEVEFLRPDAFHGSFFESVFRSLKYLIVS